ncbi:MAG: SufD family Fe-S cluster assembly protein [Chloroflexi bacterium]|nr:SufD family Fe-S cluster assembly protein [Chloroflexota bacterium]
MSENRSQVNVNDSYAEKYGFHEDENYTFKSRKGLDADIVRDISRMKGEPQWMTDFRLKSLQAFESKPMPNWGGTEALKEIKFDDIYYYIKPTDNDRNSSWEDVSPEVKRTFDKLGIPEAEQKYLSGVGAQYECLTGETRVYTDHGLIPIRDIQPGAVVFSFDEEKNAIIPARVKATACKGEREVFEVRVRTRVIRATSNHPFLTLSYHRTPGKRRGRYVRTWKYLHELKPGDLVAVAKKLPDVGQSYRLAQPRIKTTVVGRNQTGIRYDLDISNRYTPVDLPQHTSTDLMWWMGLYLGDGFIHHTNGADKARIEFAIPETDAPLRAELQRVTEQLFGTTMTNGDPNRVSINSTIIARFIEANELDGDAHTKRVPQWVYCLPEDQRLAFLGGYIDADGYVRNHASNHDIVVTSANSTLLQQVQALASSCGIMTSTLHHFESKHPFDADRKIDGYRVELSGTFDRIGCRSPQRTARMSKRRYHHDYSSAKGTTFRDHVNEHIGFARIDCITPAGVEAVYDIEVDGPHNFVAEGLIVHNSEVVYHNIAKDLAEKGVIFLSTDIALKEYPELFREYFSTVIPYTDNKFAALNSAVWSGGSFIYVPKGVKVDLPLQAYFRINAKNVGQFERTLIIVDEGAYVHYVEGCFLAGARVRTREGEKPIEQLREGDEVLTHRGRFRTVYRTMKRPYRGMIYNIRYFGDSRQTLRVTEEHPLLVVRREQEHARNKEYTPEWLPASQVKPGDYLAIPVPQVESQSLSRTRTVSVPIGHGRHAPVQRDVVLSMEPGFFRTPIENKPRQNGQTLVVCSTEMARAFAREFGSTVQNKRVPEFVRNVPAQQLAEWVRGLWCGDGSYDAHKNMFRFNTVSTELAYAFRDALLRLGIPASVNYQVRSVPRQPIYAVVISSPWNEQFGDLVGCPAPDGNQSGSPFHIDEKYMYVPIRSMDIEEMDTTVYNFSVEQDESYVCEGVVSHNCTAPIYSSDSLHSAVVEIIVKKGGRCRYTTIQNWSTNVYNLVTKRAVAYQDATMEWVDGNLGCLAEGSTVTTPDGVKTIESLNAGDKVLSYDERMGRLCFRQVAAKRFSGYQRVHTVSIGERKLRVTSNHPFYSYVYDADAPKKLGRYRLAYVRADHLTQAIIPRASLDYGAPHKLQIPLLSTEFNSSNQYAANLSMVRARDSRLGGVEYTTDDILWLFGYWVGDGNIDAKYGKTDGVIRWAKVGFSTPPTDRARGRLMETMATLVEAEPTQRADGNHLAWNSKELAELFVMNGFVGKAAGKRLPQWVWSLPESQRLAFVAGYLDADGYVLSSRRFVLKSANRALLEDIASLLVTLGITSKLYTEFDQPRTVTIQGVECTAHGSYRLSFRLDERLMTHVSARLREEAEALSPAQLVHHRAVGRSQIELPDSVEIDDVNVSEPSTALVPTWDIEVEGTGNFVSQGFIVHNSKLTMKYPAVYLMEPGAHGEVLSIAFAGKGQHQDAGGKVVHVAPNTTSKIVSKSISKDGGRTSYRGLLKVYKDAENSRSNVVCDALLLDEHSRSDTYPYIEVDSDNVSIGHEASVSKIGEEQLFYAMSRGLSEEEASTMVVSGFIEPLVKELPMEYAVEMNRLIALQMEGTVG